MNSKAAKKIRQMARRQEGAILSTAQEAVTQATYSAILGIKALTFNQRFKFSWWLLFGRGEWRGF
jgi:hypothetical protein